MLVSYRTLSIELGGAEHILVGGASIIRKNGVLILNLKYQQSDTNVFHAHYCKGYSTIKLRDPQFVIKAQIAWIWWNPQMRELEAEIKRYTFSHLLET
jgi:hypothetical protein